MKKQFIYSMYGAVAQQSEIAKHFKVSTHKIYKIAKDLNVGDIFKIGDLTIERIF